MAQYNFEGDIENITDRQLEFINKVIVENGFENSKVTFTALGIAGDNYVASIKRIVAEKENESLSIVAKVAPSNENLRININAPLMFYNEHFMYTKVLPKFLLLQQQAEVPEDEQLRFAKCYGTLIEAPNEIILLEDLKTSDFVMLDRMTSISNECVYSVLKNLAILHSLSYVLKKKEPETFDYFKNQLLDLWGTMDQVETAAFYFKQIEKNALSVLDNPEHKNTLRDKVADIVARAAKMYKYENSNKFSVIQHGDSWTNNIMFKFEEGTLKQSILIDYQISKNASPVSDLLYMIFNCTDQETRSKNYNEWIDYYYSELVKSLANFDLKANFVYPRDQLDVDLRRYGKLAFGFCVILAGVLTAKPEDASKMKEAMEISDLPDISDAMNAADYLIRISVPFKQRLIELIEDFTNFGLL